MTESFESKLDTLKARFRDRTAGDADDLDILTGQLEIACGRCDGPGNEKARDAIRAISHRLAGTAGTFGYSELTDCASSTEEIARSAVDSSDLAAAGRDLALQIRAIMEL